LALEKVETAKVIEIALGTGISIGDPESLMAKANRLIREHRNRVEQKATATIEASNTLQ
jgi:hypothetical protein